MGGVTARFYREGSWATWSDSLQSAVYVWTEGTEDLAFFWVVTRILKTLQAQIEVNGCGQWQHLKPRSTAAFAVSYTVRGDALGNQTGGKVTVWQA